MYDLHCLFLGCGSLMSGQLFGTLSRLSQGKGFHFFVTLYNLQGILGA